MSKFSTQAVVLAVAEYLTSQGHSLSQVQSAMASLTQADLDNASPEIQVNISRRAVAAPPCLVPKPAAQAEFDRALAEGRLRRFTPGITGVAQLESEVRPAKVAPSPNLTLEDLGL